jgi:hypothetical protein
MTNEWTTKRYQKCNTDHFKALKDNNGVWMMDMRT